MNNNQWTILSFGQLSVSFLVYLYRQYSKESESYKKKIQQFNLIEKDSLSNYNKSLIQILNSKGQTAIKNNQKLVLFKNVLPKYNQSTFKLYERQRSLFQKKFNPYPSQIKQHQMGGYFTFETPQKQLIRCELNDFNVSTKLFAQQTKSVQLFKNLNQIDPLVQQVITTLKPLLTVSILGKLYYDNDKLQWKIEPQFLTEASEVRKVVQKFYQDKLQWNFIFRISILVGGLVLGFYTIAKPLFSLYKKYKNSRRHQIKEFASQMEFFKDKDHLIVDSNQLLNCSVCNRKSVQIIYECGHLAICGSCHETNLEKQCAMCKKKSSKFLKIFMA